jgi:SSS family solute:Na+ symporter
MIELIVIVIYFLGMITVGLVSRGRAKKADDFFVAGRQGSTLFITGSLLATIIGGSAIMVTTSRGFTWGLTGVWWLLVGSIGLVVLGLFLARRVRKFGLYTLPELIKEQYDGRVAMAASILIVIAWTGVVAAQIIAAGKIMAILGLGSPALWMVVFTAVFIFYTVLGGQHAIIRTDSLQTVIIFAGVFGVLALLLSRFGGLGGLWHSLPSEQLSFPISPQFGAYDLVSLLLLVGLTYVVGPDMYSRLFCARDGGVARSSALWTALLIIPFALAITVIGLIPADYPGPGLPYGNKGYAAAASGRSGSGSPALCLHVFGRYYPAQCQHYPDGGYCRPMLAFTPSEENPVSHSLRSSVFRSDFPAPGIVRSWRYI